ncbi:hypothetical protein AeMF1_006661 [Aphanomyces euteiches]|nr:hypothetical protein AeMF1_006661 [Aphanomyces euteiches]KAH9181216.1 hypothetical protein AeNC1_016807 [Aphanomyces euteiches]
MWESIYNVLHSKRENDNDTAVAPKKKKRIRIFNNKAVVRQLKDEISELQAQLIQTKRFAVPKTEVSVWEAAAKQQRMEKNKSIEVNEQLQHAVRERNYYIERLQRAILKPPRWTALPDVAADEINNSLPADRALRIEAIHRMANDQYNRSQHVFIQAGVFNLEEDLHKAEPISLPHGQLGFQAINHVKLPARYNLIARACWNVMNGTCNGVLLDNKMETWEHIDECTVYNKFSSRPSHFLTCHSNEVRKLYKEENSILIVTVPVLHDENVHCKARDIVDELITWWQFVPHHEDPDICFMTVLGHSNITKLMNHEEINANADEVIAEVSRLLKGHQAGTNPPSSLRHLLDHRRRMRKPLQSSIERVIHDYIQARPRLPMTAVR